MAQFFQRWFARTAGVGIEERLTAAAGRMANSSARDLAANMVMGEVTETVCDAVHESTGIRINPTHVGGPPSAAGFLATVASAQLKGMYNRFMAEELTTPGRIPSGQTMRHVGFSPDSIAAFNRMRTARGVGGIDETTS